MINYIRESGVTNPKDLKPELWSDEKYMKPSGDYESWMSYDFDAIVVIEEERKPNELERLKEELRIKNQLLEQAATDMATMKESFKRMLVKDEPSATSEALIKVKKGHENGVASISLDNDEGYFETYSHFSIHHAMLSDKVRTETYRDAILNNSSSFAGKDVLDLGCGTGILSLFASQAGAKNVYAVDQSEIIYNAMEIAQVNKAENIKFIKGRMEDVEMPFKKVDIIISEWMGYFLFFEGMLDSLIYSRKNYLNEGGLLLPNRCTISIVGYGNQERYANFIKFFENVYGYNMKCMLKDILREAHVETCDDAYVLTKPNVICDLDIMTCELNYSNFSYDFNLEVIKDSKLTSIVGYFDTFFDLPAEISFSTSPAAIPTHWRQAVFYLDEPVDVKIGEVITGKFICQRDQKDLRSLKVELRIFEKTFKYDLN